MPETKIFPVTVRNVNPTLTRRLVTLIAAAEYLGCSPASVRRYIAAGQLPAYRMGRRMLRIDLNEVDAVLRAVPAT